MGRVVAITALLIASRVAGPARSEPARARVVVYWMCCDNDLEPAGRAILHTLARGP